MRNFHENPDTPESSRNTGSPESSKNTELDSVQFSSKVLEEEHLALTEDKTKWNLHMLVVVIKDYPEFNVFTGYVGRIIDFPDNDKTVCLVEFEDFTSPESDPTRQDSFYLSKDHLIRYYPHPLLTFKKPLHWNKKKFLV